MLNFVHDHEATSRYLDDELGKKILIFNFGMV